MATRAPDIRKLAHRQRWMLWLILASILVQILPFLDWGRFGPIVVIGNLIVQLVLSIFMIIGIVYLLSAQGTHPVVTVICAILSVIPCVSLLILLLANARATRTLRAAGLRVGFMGVKPDEVERLLNLALCRTCGYNLTGNVSGACPECGQANAIRSVDGLQTGG